MGERATTKQMADAFKTMCRYSMSVMIECESKEAVAVFYGGNVAREPCPTAQDAPAAMCRAIARCAVLADKMLAATLPPAPQGVTNAGD